MIPETLHPLARGQVYLKHSQDAAAKPCSPTSKLPVKTLAFDYILKPLRMLLFEPVLGVVTAFISLVYGILYLSLYAIPYSFMHERSWSLRRASLPFLCVLAGSLLAFVVLALGLWLQQRKRKNSVSPTPEDRLPPMIGGACLLLAGLLWFAFTSPPVIPWIVHSLACVCVGCGIIMIFVPGIAYIVEIYPTNVNSALAANAFARSLIATGFPHLSGKMYQDLGTKWATCVLALSCALLAPFPVLLFMYGRKIRDRMGNGRSLFLEQNCSSNLAEG